MEPTRDSECVRFLQWALPRLGYRWEGFRKVRRQVCRRVRRRRRDLELASLQAYRLHLERTPGEWAYLDDCCRITISRFYRDRGLWETAGREILPRLYRQGAARSPHQLRVWSAGCGAGEEPYTVAMLLRLGPNPLPDGFEVEILGTDVDLHQLERARRGVYPESSLRDLPAEWRRQAFTRTDDDRYRLRDRLRGGVRLVEQDIRREAPAGRFHLVLCRNLAFTYFDSEGQEQSLMRLLSSLEPDGWLAVGSHENVPEHAGFVRHTSGAPLFTRSPAHGL